MAGQAAGPQLQRPVAATMVNGGWQVQVPSGLHLPCSEEMAGLSLQV